MDPVPVAPVPVRDWGDAFAVSLKSSVMVFMGALPRVLAFILILVIGWFLASLLAKGVALLLRNVRFNELADRAGFTSFVNKMGVETDAAGFVAATAKWFVRLIALVVAFDALGLPGVSGFLQEVLRWMPNLVVAIVVLVIGGLAAKALSNLVRGATAQAGLGNPNLLASIASVAVWSFAIIVAVNQLGIGTEVVNTLFMATVGALALAVGLAFGLGGRETAGRLLNDWYERGRQAKPRLQQAGHAMHDPMQQQRPYDPSNPYGNGGPQGGPYGQGGPGGPGGPGNFGGPPRH